MFNMFHLPIMAVIFAMIFGTSSPANAFVLTPFGLSGSKTLTNAAKKQDNQNIFSSNLEAACLTVALYHEARGEPLIGQIAVGETIINRARSRAYPASICGVVFQNAHRINKCQFSFACDGISDKMKNRDIAEKLKTVAGKLLSIFSASRYIQRSDFFNAKSPYMTHYHRFDVHPSWSKKLIPLAHIGNHVFFRSERVVKKYGFDLLTTAAITQLPAINASNEIGL